MLLKLLEQQDSPQVDEFIMPVNILLFDKQGNLSAIITGKNKLLTGKP